MSALMTGCPECGQPMEQTENHYFCRGCGHKGEQLAIPIEDAAEQLTLF